MSDVWCDWFQRSSCTISNIKLLEERLSIVFPVKYINIMMVHNGGYLIKNMFDYYDIYKSKMIKGNDVGLFLKIDLKTTDPFEETVENYTSDPPEFFPAKLVPFAVGGGGNLTCFDYRNSTDNPNVVFWCHYDNEGEDVHFVANTFEEFLSILYASED